MVRILKRATSELYSCWSVFELARRQDQPPENKTAADAAPMRFANG